MSGYPRFRRRHYFINRGIQGRFVAVFSTLVLAGFLVNLIAAYFLIDSALATGLYKSHLRIAGTSRMVWPYLWRIGIAVVPFIVVAATAVGYLLTRRLEYPLMDILGAFRKAAGGDFTTRLEPEHEGLEGVYEGFNRAAERLEHTFLALKDRARFLERDIERLEYLLTEVQGASPEEVDRELKDLSAHREGALKELTVYKV